MRLAAPAPRPPPLVPALRVVVESDKRLALFCSPSCSSLSLEAGCWQARRRCLRGCGQFEASKSGSGPVAAAARAAVSKDVIRRQGRSRAAAGGKSDGCHQSGASGAPNDFCHAPGDVLAKRNCQLAPATSRQQALRRDPPSRLAGHWQNLSLVAIESADSETCVGRTSLLASAEGGNRGELELGAECCASRLKVSRARDRDDGAATSGQQHFAPTIGQQQQARDCGCRLRAHLLELTERQRRRTNDNKGTIKSEPSGVGGCQIMIGHRLAQANCRPVPARQPDDASANEIATATATAAMAPAQAATPPATTFAHLTVSSSPPNNCCYNTMINFRPRKENEQTNANTTTTRTTTNKRKNQTERRKQKRDKPPATAEACDKKWLVRASLAALSCQEQTQVEEGLNRARPERAPRRKQAATGWLSFQRPIARPLFLSLMMMMLAAAGDVSSGSSASSRRAASGQLAAQDTHKFELWLSLVHSLYAPNAPSSTSAMSSSQPPSATRIITSSATHKQPSGGGSVRSSQLELLAQRLARWPDQKRAALFFIEQLAQRLESPASAETGQFCRQISWAQLSEPSAPTTEASSLQRQVALDRLAASNRKLVEHLNRRPASSQAARLALDSANLITRLLLSGSSDQLKGDSAQDGLADSAPASGFFGSFLNAFKLSASGQETGSERQAASASSPMEQVEREADDLIKDTRNLELLLNRLVTPKFLRYLLAMKLREHVTPGRPVAGQLVHSMGTLMFEADHGNVQAAASHRQPTSHERPEWDEQLALVSQMRVSFATVAQLQPAPLASQHEPPSIKFIDLLSPAGPNGAATGGNGAKGRLLAELPFGDRRPPSFVARWILADRLGELDKLKRRLGSPAVSSQLQMDADRHQLALADGEWFSPHFDCALGKRWLLTYSAPLFAHANNGSIRFRGISFVSLDLARSGALMNQCATGGISLLANSSQCRTRLPGSQCVPLASHLQFGQGSSRAEPQFRPGAYACQCPASWPHLGPGRRAANLQRRKELIELLVGGPRRAAADKSQSDARRDHDAHQRQLAPQQHKDNDDDERQPAGQHAHANRGQLDESDLSFIGFQTALEEKQGQRWQQTANSLNDKRFLGQLLASTNPRRNTSSGRNAGQHEQQQQQPYFAMGAQLEAEAALEWLASEQESPPPGARRMCQLCKEAATETNSQSPPPTSRALECQSSGPIESGEDTLSSLTLSQPSDGGNSLAWLRPLVLIVQSVSLVITLGLICVILRIRKSRLIIVSGWLMLETMLIGAVLLHTSILIRYFQPTSLTCLLEPWFRELGFSIFYGSILIKLYRILTEFQTRKAHRVCLRDKDQIIYLLAIVFIVIGYMSAWTALMVDGFFVSSEPTAAAFDIATGPGATAAPTFDSAPGEMLSRIERRAVAAAAAAAAAQRHGPDLDDRPDAPLDLAGLNLSPGERPTSSSLARQRAAGMLALYAPETGGQLRRKLAAPPTTRPDHLATAHANLNAKLSPATKERRAVSNHSSGRSARASLSSLALEDSEAGSEDNEADGHDSAHKAPPNSHGYHQPRRHQQRQQLELEPQQSQWPVAAQSSERESGTAAEGTSSLSAGAGLAGEHLEILARGLNSFGELFLGLLESEHHYEPESDTLVYLIRCRKLTWDYVTESSEIALLLFGVHLVYKLRNASMELHKEKLILSVAIFIELLISSSLYLVRHTLWHQLTGDHLLILYALRCQLTVTLTVALVFGPQLWQIGESKPSLLLSALFNYSFHQYNHDHSNPDSGGPSGGSSSGDTGAAGASSRGAAAARGNRGNSTRHRCHISCEVHDHHLGDASRLQQAMLSNSALEIGSINLADMDPDEIQAELKRVYTQLELLKTKVMRRDNPHISKRRGGRKPGHRKFSLQAFHNRHSSSGEQHHAANAPTSQNNELGAEAGEQVGLLAANRQAQQLSNQYPSTSAAGGRLPALAELDGETSSSCAAEQRASKAPLGIRISAGRASNNSGKHVRVDEIVLEYTDERADHQTKPDNKFEPNERFKPASLASKLMGRSKAKKQQLYQQNSRNGSNSKWAPELPSTSSLGLDDETMVALNDSQSSGELTPQHRSSIVYSSSYHNEEQSSIN